MPTTTPLSASARAAGAIVVLEALGITALAGWQAVALVSGDVESPTTAIALLVLTLAGAAAVLAFGIAVLRGQSWGRSGAIVTQLLILAVALGAVTGSYAHPLVALALATPAVIAFVLLVLASRRGPAESDADPKPGPGAEG